MRIMYIVTGSGLSGNISGSSMRSIEIAKRLAKSGHEIHFLTTIGGYEASKNKYIRYHLLPASIFKKKETWLFDRLFAYVISTVSSFWGVPRLPKCDISYTDSDYFCDIVPAILYKRAKKSRWIAMTHHKIKITYKKPRDFIFSSVSSMFQSFSYWLFKKYADKVFVYKSDMGKLITQYLISIGMSPSKIQTVTNGVDLDFIDSIPKTSKIYDACLIGGLRPSKGLYHIVPIWKNVAEKKKNAVLAIVGGVPREYINELKSLISKEGLESNIKMLGAKQHNEAMAILAKSRIFFFPSNEEGWGIAICEAMACGLPVVAWDLPVYKTIYPKGIVRIPLGGIQRFSTAVLDLLTDERYYKEISKDARAIAEKYDWNDISIKEAIAFQKVLGDR
jgi:glycosyltransferase involved in cell wall biosynthesis